jgi:hypothetical protein
LIDSVPSGTPFIFQLAALQLGDPAACCDDETLTPIRIFSGYSDPIVSDARRTNKVHEGNERRVATAE